jgi:tetrapyrrole methylase family protein/MazG family protein
VVEAETVKEFDRLLHIVEKLRSPQGCPWDRAQTVANYKKYLLEEAYELIESINARDAGMCKEEIGDLLLILVAISSLFKEKRQFGIDDALKSINEKLISRHPHVFSSKRLSTKEEVLAYWIEAKAKKKKRKTVKDRLPHSAPALLLAEIFLKEASHQRTPRERKRPALRNFVSAIMV